MNYGWNRRQYLCASASLAVIAGCASSGEDDQKNGGDSEPTDDTNHWTDNENDEYDGLVFEEGQTHSFEGDGATETDRFALDRGLMRYRYESDANQETFTSQLVDMERDGSSEYLDDRSLTNYMAPIQGELMNIVSGGEYLIDVDVEGPWSIEIDQPALTQDETKTLPVDVSGSAPSYVGPVELHSDAEVHATHRGDSVFSVHSITLDGHWDVPVNDSGELETTRVFRDEGVAWISIVGDGDWSITIE